MSDPRTITRLLRECRDDDTGAEAFDSLMPLVYNELRQLARQQLARMRSGQTLDTTALANESYLKLQNHVALDWTDRQHFYAIAARAMRQILVDYARQRNAGKRYGDKQQVDLDSIAGDSDERAAQLMHVDELLDRLSDIDSDLVRVVECRFFAGYSHEETSSVLGISMRTVQRRWQRARAWLRELELASRDDPQLQP